MSHPQGVGPRRLWEAFAWAPHESRPGHTQGSAVAFEGPLSAPSHAPEHAVSWARRVLWRRLSWVEIP
jgi:hypothetical protein